MPSAGCNTAHPARVHAGLVAIVDDDAYVLRALQRALTAYDYRVKIFASAEQYLREAKACDISCAVVDIHLGSGLSGLELAEKITSASPTTPIIFMSASWDANVRKRAREIGYVTFLDKPFMLSSLLGALMSLDSEQS
jgi:FixJ family two-component response regulator